MDKQTYKTVPNRPTSVDFTMEINLPAVKLFHSETSATYGASQAVTKISKRRWSSERAGLDFGWN